MNTHTFEKLQYNTLKEIVKSYCLSSLGKDLIDRLMPSSHKATVMNRLLETSEARNLLDYSGAIPLQGIMQIQQIVEKVDKDGILDPEELSSVAAFCRGCKTMKRYMADKEFYAPTLKSYSLGIKTLSHLEEIEGTIRGNGLDDNASRELKRIRRHIALAEADVKEKLEKFLKSSQNKSYIQDFFISKRQGRLTVPIKAAYKNKVDGIVIESSQKTVFIEPHSVSKAATSLLNLQIEEEMEVYKILSHLTGLVYEELDGIKANIEIMAQYDMIIAKGKYSRSIDGISPKINDYGKIHIVKGKHPLLKGNVVPLDIEIGKDYRTLIITGPNAGGKTIVLKTVGILTLATQLGLHIPASQGTELSIFEKVFVDIGDDQSIENSLSTFSSHVKNLAGVIKETNKRTLLLFDEIGSGTEPGEGAALAIAILEKVYHKGAITIATTHYNEIKNFSSQHPDFENAAMRFSKETLTPLYELLIGKIGESNALWISKKMGIDEDILEKAKEYMLQKDYNVSKVNEKKIITPVIENEFLASVKQQQYEMGDRVYLIDYDESGIVYKGQDDYSNLEVLYKGEIIKIHEKKVKLEIKREKLYPAGYDLNSLFISFKERKLEKDIKRGSKKILKKIRKDGIESLK